MSGLRITIFFLGSIAPVVLIVAGWLIASRVRRFGWLVVLTFIVLSLPVGFLIVSLAIGPPPPPDLEESVLSSGVVWGMYMLPTLALWALAVAGSVLIPPLAWLARSISD